MTNMLPFWIITLFLFLSELEQGNGLVWKLRLDRVHLSHYLHVIPSYIDLHLNPRYAR